MQVSDLDGTMVGNGPEADSMTRRFTQFWEDNAVLRNSVLVYNTGRSLGQFTSLYHEKADALALPNVLITAVGTKVSLHTTLCTTKHAQLEAITSMHDTCQITHFAIVYACLDAFHTGAENTCL